MLRLSLYPPAGENQDHPCTKGLYFLQLSVFGTLTSLFTPLPKSGPALSTISALAEISRGVRLHLSSSCWLLQHFRNLAAAESFPVWKNMLNYLPNFSVGCHFLQLKNDPC